MKRREAFKKMGLLSLAGISGIALASCNTKEESKSTAMQTAPKTERERLIVNREHKKIADPANPTKAELKHTPDIQLGSKDTQGNTLVTITVGKDGIIHPYTKEHWIDFIKVYVNDRLLAETEFANGGIRGYGSYYISLQPGDLIKAESGCNKHGIWESELRVESL